MKQIVWEQKHQGISYSVNNISDENLSKEAFEKRLEMIDSLSGYDDKIAEAIIASESLENVSTDMILKAMRKLNFDRKIVPMIM